MADVLAVGTRVSVRWQMNDGTDEWYGGAVTRVCGSAFVVQYDLDGKSLKHDHYDVQWKVVKPKRKIAAVDISKNSGKGGTITVEVDGEMIVMRKDFVDAVLYVSHVRAKRVHQRFVEGCAPDELRDRKTYFFRETDRHSMYYVRARTAMLWSMRHGAKGSHNADTPAADLGRLTQAEAEAVVFSTACFRLYNRLGTFTRWNLLRAHVEGDPDTAEVACWEAALKRLTAEDYDEIHRTERTWSDERATTVGKKGRNGHTCSSSAAVKVP